MNCRRCGKPVPENSRYDNGQPTLWCSPVCAAAHREEVVHVVAGGRVFDRIDGHLVECLP